MITAIIGLVGVGLLAYGTNRRNDPAFYAGAMFLIAALLASALSVATPICNSGTLSPAEMVAACG
jgi:hypothetical protein